MARIFVAHSKKDKELRDFFSNAFSGTGVAGIFEEFEKIIRGEVTPEQVAKDIEESKAIFVILSQNVENIPHTRDWVVWETGVARNKDIWVFEPSSQFGKISVVIPYLRNYAIFDFGDKWFGYIRTVIESYDDSHTLPTVLLTGLTGTGIGATLAKKDKAGGAILGGLVGAIAGLLISDKSKKRPVGLNVECVNCHSTYSIHTPKEMDSFRCPVCNTSLTVKRGEKRE